MKKKNIKKSVEKPVIEKPKLDYKLVRIPTYSPEKKYHEVTVRVPVNPKE